MLALFWVRPLTAAVAPTKHERNKSFRAEKSKQKLIREFDYDALSYLDSELKLAESLDERHSFDVTDGSAELDDAHFWLDISFDGLLGHSFDPFLNGICDMWHN